MTFVNIFYHTEKKRLTFFKLVATKKKKKKMGPTILESCYKEKVARATEDYSTLNYHFLSVLPSTFWKTSH